MRICPVCQCRFAQFVYKQSLATFQDCPLDGEQVIVCCQYCGMIYVDTSQSQKEYDTYYESVSKYHDPRTSSTGAESGWEDIRVQKITESVMKHFPDKSARLLDAGCGRGNILALLKASGYMNLAGLDPSPACIQRISKELGIECKQGLLSNPGYPSQSFDGIILARVIEHIVDLKTVLSNIRDLLRPSGKVYAEVPDVTKYLKQTSSPFQDFSLEHISHFTVTSLKNLFSQHGYNCLEVAEKPEVGLFSCEVREVYGIFSPSPCKIPVRGLFTEDPAVETLIKEYMVACNEELLGVAHFIQETVDIHPRIIVWGTGQLTLKLLGSGILPTGRIVGFTDGNGTYHGRKLCGIPILAPEEIKGMVEPILVASILHAPGIENRIRNDLGMSNELIRLPVGEK